MRIGFLFPSVLASRHYSEGRIFAPRDLAIVLVNGLVERGHEVTLYASKDVKTRATKHVGGDEHLSDDTLTYFQFRNRVEEEKNFTLAEIIKRDFEFDLTMRAYQDAQAGSFDIIHSYHDFGAHYFNELTGFPTVYTLHDPLPQRTDTIEYQRFHKFSGHNYISISNSQRRGALELNFVATVHHGLALTEIEYSDHPEEHLIHFGRIMEDKGTDIAISAAKAAGIPLAIATSSIRGNRSQTYFDTKIAPLIDGVHVSQVGFLTGPDKSKYIGAGKAFIFPLQWDEPFGMVMIEAMTAGTPVIAYNRGSVPEIIRDGVTGFIIDPDDTEREGRGTHVIKQTGVEGLVEAIKRVGEIDRAACRKHVEENFSIQKMVEGHEAVYQKILQKK